MREMRETSDLVPASLGTLGTGLLTSTSTDNLEARASLPERFLLWLLQHPFQRAEDLGLALHVPRSSAYRHVARLCAQGLVEQVRLSRELRHSQSWYYLTTDGLCRVASLVGANPDKLAQMWGTQEAALLRHLPRLHAWVLLQNVLNGLIRAAPTALAYPGGHPAAIRWHWCRDYHATFQHKQARMRCHLDTALVLARHPLPARGTEAPFPQPREYLTLLFLLDPGLDGNHDLHLMQERLGRLLRLRESHERWSQYHTFPPLLILVSTPHQRDLWQACAREAAAKARLAPLQGAIVAHPPEAAVPSSWTLPWHTLSDNVSCHVQHLLQPVEHAALLPNLLAPKAAPVGTFVHQDAPASSGHQRIVRGHFQARAAALVVADHQTTAAAENVAVSLLGIRLSRRQIELLHLLYAHPLLSAAEIAVLVDLKVSSIDVYLSQLRHLRCLRTLVSAHGQRVLLTERGLRYLAASLQVSPLHLGEPIQRGSERRLVQRGLSSMQRHLKHLSGLYGFVCSVTQTARTQGNALVWWETGARCARRYRSQGTWHNLLPDALLAYRAQKHMVYAWLEWDEGSMRRRQLHTKCEAYRHYLQSRHWYQEAPILPLLLFVVPDYDQEVRVAQVIRDVLGNTPLYVRVTTASLLRQQGPLAEIWKPMLPCAAEDAPPARVSWLPLLAEP